MVIGALHDLTGWRRFAAAFLAGSLSVLAHAPFHLWPVLFLTLPVLVWLVDGITERHTQTHSQTGQNRKSLFKKAAATGWAFGFGYFLFGLYWIGKAFLVEAGIYIFLMPIAMTLMPAGLALFYALAIGFAALFWRPGLSRVLILAVLLAITEWLRGHILTGFPWNALGHVFAGEAGLSQLSSLLGPYALSFFCVLIFTSPAIAADKKSPKNINFSMAKPPLVIATLLLAASLWGHQRLSAAVDENVDGVRLRLVQPNIKQVDKWRPGNAAPIYRTMLKMSGQQTKTTPQGLAGITHLIWPESALPFFMARSKDALQGIDNLLPNNTTLITGAMRHKTTGKTKKGRERAIFNSLFIVDDKAKITQTFDKKHLVPFGEYLPFHGALEQIGLRKIVQVRGHFEFGQQPRLIKLKNVPPFAPLICYEVVFPDEIIEDGERPSWLVNLTNDAWYGVSTGPYQHFVQSRIRAIEQGLPMVRVANTGISGVIDPYGRVRQSLPLASAGIIDAALPAAISKTIYARYGALLFWCILMGAITLILIIARAEK
jgi:apolipoprotein N-acyltransferase